MKVHDATEQAYKNGYAKGYADAVKNCKAIEKFIDSKLLDGKEYEDGELYYQDFVKELEKLYEKAEKVRGRWKRVGHVCVDGEYVDVYRCGKCSIPHDTKTRYCPNCGAKMDGGNEDGATQV